MRFFGCGINKYKDSPLQGCLTDITITREIVKLNRLVNASNDIRIAFDDRATVVGSKERMKWLTSEPMVHSNLLFHYSGHGSQVPVVDYKNNEEFDGLDEIICPYDFNWEGNWIDDNFISTILKNKPNSTKLVMIFDCCHSGTIFKGQSLFENAITPKSLTPPQDIRMRDPNYHSDLVFLDTDLSISLPKLVVKPKEILTVPNTIVITGCKDNQVSADAQFSDGSYHGVLSYFLQTIWYNNPKMAVPDLIAAVCAEIKKYGFTQEPQLHYGPGTDLSKLI